MKTYPALVANVGWALATDSDTDNVGGGVEETLAEVDQVLVTHLLNKLINSHGGNELLVTNGLAILQGNGLGIGIDLGDSTLGTKSGVLLWQSVGNSDPDTTGTVTSWETESGVWTPVTSGLLENDVLGDSLEIWSGDTLTEPCALHLEP
jgi:hypothetical protein